MKTLNKYQGCYWHELTEEEFKEVFSAETLVVSDLLKTFKQPDWCNYPNAITPMIGCWSLAGSNRTKISPDYCKGCDEFKKC